MLAIHTTRVEWASRHDDFGRIALALETCSGGVQLSPVRKGSAANPGIGLCNDRGGSFGLGAWSRPEDVSSRGWAA